ncbi:hypothetical protein SPSIL_041280 [Sporomusa silvacetica DSM 10669]|uniref:Uncharacterized protein n=1 Tax=Sporomusa silvacetica DSM 10669 TaxID=1123289 RepID=A0ABZ3IQJ1_9FIRM|nr:hypothetical protein [Sporomusa silvacetica]OZC20390.1 hypothetical protein SPSIL_12570 [Sporomusa silvacetica DSM 10669]
MKREMQVKNMRQNNETQEKGNANLLVPIAIEALVVGQQDSAMYADRTAHYDRLNNCLVFGDDLIADPFVTTDRLQPGVHLHWALPDALTHGRQTAVITAGAFAENESNTGIAGVSQQDSAELYQQLETNNILDQQGQITAQFTPDHPDFTLGLTAVYQQWEEAVCAVLQNALQGGQVEYPAVPNRWFITRMHTDETNPAVPVLSLKSWVVESDYLFGGLDDGSEVSDGSTIPVWNSAAKVLDFRYLGQCFNYADWQPGNHTEYLDKLAAVGPGDPAFAAYYPSCKSVFGFHDSLADITSGNLTYVVCGWYAQAGQDPLYGQTSSDLWNNCLAALQWGVSDTDDSCPTLTICHGMVCQLVWAGANASYPSGIPVAQPDIAIGKTSAEALAALLQQKLPEEQNIERVMEAFQYDMLSVLDQPDGIVQLEQTLHEKSFSYQNGGVIWKIQQRGSEVEGEQDAPSDFPAGMGSALDVLNKSQKQYEDVQAVLVSLQWELYATWYKFICERGEPPNPPSDKLKPIMDLIGTQAKEIAAVQGQIASLAAALQQQADALANDVAVRLSGYILCQDTQTRFWQPNEPVILLAGEGVGRSFKHGEDGRFSEDGTLACRVSGQVLTGLTLTVGDQMVTVGEAQLLPFYQQFPVGATIPDAVGELFIESLLLDTSQAGVIAAAALRQAGIASPSADQLQALRTTVTNLQTGIWNASVHRELKAGLLAETLGFSGLVPSKVGVAFWDAPWTPLFMSWKVNYLQYIDGQPDLTGILQQWSMGDTDYECAAAALPQVQRQHVFAGQILLTPQAAVNVKQMLDKSLAYLSPDDPDYSILQDISAKVGNLNILSQTLSGLNNSLIMRKQTLQFPVFDIPDEDYGNQKLAQQVADWIGDQNHVAPQVMKADDASVVFNPIMAGFMQLLNLWIVDAFGRIKTVEVVNPRPVLAESLVTDSAAFADWITVQPRVVQPSRLLFRWQAADQADTETNSDPSTSPVCGWILPNHLDRSLQVYAANGTSLGSLQPSYSGTEAVNVRWLSSPGTKVALSDIENAELQNFVAGLLACRNSQEFIDFLAMIDESLWTIDPLGERKDISLSALIGRPLALVKASLKLELEGNPAWNQTWESLGKNDTAGFEKVEFPLRLGDTRQLHDGLIGYFVQDGEQTYRTCYAAYGSGKQDDADGYVQYQHSVPLSCDSKQPSTAITLLLDPRAGVHITSGILPTGYAQLPPAHIRKSLAALAATFYTGPVIGSSTEFGLPLPTTNEGSWSWNCVQPDGSWQENSDIGKAPGNAVFSPGWPHIFEGWLKLQSTKEKE